MLLPIQLTINNLPIVISSGVDLRDYSSPNFVINADGELDLAEYDVIPVPTEPVAGPSGLQSYLNSSAPLVEDSSDSDDDIVYPIHHSSLHPAGALLEDIFGASTRNSNWGMANGHYFDSG